MTKEEYHALLAEVGGGGCIGEEAEDARRRSEAAVTAYLNDNYGGVLLLGDAINQFYTDTLRELAQSIESGKIESIPTPAQQTMLQFFASWHILSASRYYAAFDLIRRGYYFEAVALARTLWETALSMAAVYRKLVSVQELFGGMSDPDNPLSSEEIEGLVRAADRKVQNGLLWNNIGLDAEAKSAFNVFRTIANHATHKSSLGVAFHMALIERRESVPLFPRFDKQLTEMTNHALFLSTWCLMTTLGYLRDLLPSEGTKWDSRYRKLLLAFEHLSVEPPNEVVKGFAILVKRVFESPATT